MVYIVSRERATSHFFNSAKLNVSNRRRTFYFAVSGYFPPVKKDAAMTHQEQLQALMVRIDALEQRERQLTYASNAYQAILTTLLGIVDKTTRDRVISMVDQAHDVAYAKASLEQKGNILGADDITQRIFLFAQGRAAQSK
jgi:hemoglobin-like flavoprotein